MRSPEMRRLISRKGSSVSEIVCVNCNPQVQRSYNTRWLPHRRRISCVAEVPYQCSVDRFVLLRILQKDTRNLGPFCCSWPPLPLDGRIRC